MLHFIKEAQYLAPLVVEDLNAYTDLCTTTTTATTRASTTTTKTTATTTSTSAPTTSSVTSTLAQKTGELQIQLKACKCHNQTRIINKTGNY